MSWTILFGGLVIFLAFCALSFFVTIKLQNR